MAPRRSLLSFVGALAVTLVLAGCTLLPGLKSTPTAPPSAKPAVGQCWNATATQAYDWADWKGPTATACTRSHTLYTYQVGKI